MDERLTTDERFERDLRAGLAALLDPIAESHPRWATSPAAERALSAPAHRTLPWLGWSMRRIALVGAAAALLVAALVGALIGARLLERTPLLDTAPRTPLQPTGIEVLDPGSTGDGEVVVDGKGAYWAIGGGRLTRFDPDTGERTTWTVSDDVAFGEMGTAAPAATGGVWIEMGDDIRRFDGTAFRETTPAPPDGIDPWEMSTERPFEAAPDGTLWSVSLYHWDGSAWVEPPPGGPGWVELQAKDDPSPAGQRSPRAFARDGIWVATGATVARLADGRWTIYGPADTGHDMDIDDIAVASDGSVWIDSSAGALVRFDGHVWADVERPAGLAIGQLVAAPDGSVWTVSNTWAEWDTSIKLVGRYADGRWTTYGLGDGLVGELGPMAATPAGVFLSTRAGVLRFIDDAWVPALPGAQLGPDPNGWPFRILPVSGDEAWVSDGEGIWHYRDGLWDAPTAPSFEHIVGGRINAAALGPDGAVWVAEDAGVAVLRDGRWLIVATDVGLDSLAIDSHGTAWGSEGGSSVVAVSSDPSVGVRRFRCPFVTSGWASPPLVVASDDSVYVAGNPMQGGSGLFRIEGTTCTAVDLLGDGEPHEVLGIAAGPGGRIAAFVVIEPSTETTEAELSILLFDGTRWTSIGGPDEIGYTSSLLFDTQGRLWRVSSGGGNPLERYDGTSWVPAGPEPFRAHPTWDGRAWSSPLELSIAPDGTFWFRGSSGGVQRVQADE